LGDTIKVFRSIDKTDAGYVCHLLYTSSGSQVFKAVLSFE